MARALDAATISFGLVSIPIKVYSTNAPERHISFHFVHRGCGARLRQHYACPEHGDLERDEIARAYEYAKGKLVELSDEELEALEAVSSNTIAFEEFVPATAIDPLYLDRSYYLGPGKGGERAYHLLAEAMSRTELVAVASYAARGKQYVVEVRPYQDGLVMHQLRYEQEIRSWSEVPVPARPKLRTAELELAEQLIRQVATDSFDASKYRDEVQGRIRALIKRKLEGKPITAPKGKPAAKVTDLMEALKASLGAAPGERRPAAHARIRRSTRARPATGRSTRASARTATRRPRRRRAGA